MAYTVGDLIVDTATAADDELTYEVVATIRSDDSDEEIVGRLTAVRWDAGARRMMLELDSSLRT